VRLWNWWTRTVPGRDRLVLAAAVTVRLAGVAMLGYSVPLVWARLPYPGATVLLALGMAVQSLAVVAWWLYRRRLDPAAVLVDLPAGLVVLVLGGALARPGVPGWTWFGYPYTILVSLALGLACRSLAVVLGVGALWAGAALVAALGLVHARLPLALSDAPPFLVVPVVGWLCARLLRRTTDELDEARAVAEREVAALATAQERDRHTRALHDRVLQTLETLARGAAIGDPDTRDRVREQAEWLRRYVETGRVPADDLATGLAAVARLGARDGVAVQLNDARLRLAEPATDLPPAHRDLLVSATHEAVTALGRPGADVVVRATPEDGGVLVTVLALGTRETPGSAAQELADTQEQVRRAGGRASVDPLPYVELWLPTG
jgi:signal transduction histidine kinase